MSWSYKIVIVYASFVVMMLSMVYVSSKQTNEMQDENYYAKELVYQSVIDGKNNLNALSEPLTITNSSEGVKIQLPSEATDNITDGTVFFLRPSNKQHDVAEKLIVNSNGEQFISNAKFEKGFYTVKISWKSNGIDYLAEKKFNAE